MKCFHQISSGSLFCKSLVNEDRLEDVKLVPEVVDGGDVDVDAALEAPGQGGTGEGQRVGTGQWARQLAYALLCLCPSRRLPNEDSLFST